MKFRLSILMEKVLNEQTPQTQQTQQVQQKYTPIKREIDMWDIKLEPTKFGIYSKKMKKYVIFQGDGKEHPNGIPDSNGKKYWYNISPRIISQKLNINFTDQAFAQLINSLRAQQKAQNRKFIAEPYDIKLEIEPSQEQQGKYNVKNIVSVSTPDVETADDPSMINTYYAN